MFEVVENGLDATIYQMLREKVGFKEYAQEDVCVALAHSLYSVVIYDQQRPIGIARIVGDGRICFFLKDVVVDPVYQKLKIGKLIMQYLFKYFHENACEGAYIGLMSTPQCIPFYEKYGFVQRPCEGMGPGMIKFYNKEEVMECKK